MAGTTSYSYVVMKFAAAALGKAFTTTSNCPAALDLSDLDIPAPAVPNPPTPVLTGGLLPPSSVAMLGTTETVEGMEAEQAKAAAKAAAARLPAPLTPPAVGSAAILSTPTATPIAPKKAAPGTLVTESAAGSLVPAAADVGPAVGAGGTTKTGVVVFAAIPAEEEDPSVDDSIITDGDAAARRLKQLAATRAATATPTATPAAAAATPAAATAYEPTITITFMFGFSENKTFPYGKGSTTVPTSALKWTMEAANW
jgi:hypothetical protein